MPTHPHSVLVLARHDSFLKAGLHLAVRLSSEMTRREIVLVPSHGARLSLPQLAALGLQREPRALAMSDVCQRTFLEQFDLVVLSLDGRHSRRFLRRFHDIFASDTRARPLVVSLYPGIIFRFHYEGMQSRMSADLVLLNSAHDLGQYNEMLGGLGIADSNGVDAGLSYLDACRFRDSIGDGIVFFGQPTVPPAVHERAYVVHRLLDIARRYPRHHVILKPRHRPGEATLHRDRYQFADIVGAFSARARLPDNFTLSYQPVQELLQSAALALTVSSTAALEALAAGVPTRILTDFGIHENLGNNFFLGSGLLCTFDDISPSEPYVLDQEWSKRHVHAGSTGCDGLTARVQRLLRERDERGELPLRSARLLGRTRGFCEFAAREFDRTSAEELESRPWRRLWWHWQRLRFGAACRRLARMLFGGEPHAPV